MPASSGGERCLLGRRTRQVGDDGRFAGAYGFANRVWRARNTLKTRFECGLDREALTDVTTLQEVARHPDESASGYLVLRVVQRQPRSPGWSSWDRFVRGSW